MIHFNYWSHWKLQQQLKLLLSFSSGSETPWWALSVSAFLHSDTAAQPIKPRLRSLQRNHSMGLICIFPSFLPTTPPQLRFKYFGISLELSNLKHHGQVLLSTPMLMHHTAKEKMCLENFSLEANQAQAWMCSANRSQLVPYCKYVQCLS